MNEDWEAWIEELMESGFTRKEAENQIRKIRPFKFSKQLANLELELDAFLEWR